MKFSDSDIICSRAVNMERTIRILLVAVVIGACTAGNGYNYDRPVKYSGKTQPIVTKSVYVFSDPDSAPRQRTVSYKQAAPQRQRTSVTYTQTVPQQRRTTYTQTNYQQRRVVPQQKTVIYTQTAPQAGRKQYSTSRKQITSQQGVSFDASQLPFINQNTAQKVPQIQYTAPQQVQYVAPQQTQYNVPQVTTQQPQVVQQVQYTAPQVKYAAPQKTRQQVQYATPQVVTQQVQYVAPQEVPQQVQYVSQQPQYTAPQFTQQQVQYATPQVVPQEIQYAQVAPQQPQYTNPTAPVAKQNIQVLFVKTPGYEAYTEALLKMAKEAIQSQTVVYVLSKEPDYDELTRRFQEIQADARKMPEVRFVKYKTEDEAVELKKAIQAEYESLPGPSKTYGTQIGTIIGGGNANVIGSSIESGSVNYSNDEISATLPLTKTTTITGTTNPSGNEDDVHSQNFPPFLPTGIDVVPGSSYLPPGQN